MTDQHYSETFEIKPGTNHPGRIRERLAKYRFQDEGRKQRQIESDRQAAVQIRAMIAKLDLAVSSLDDSINAVLETMTARRENLKSTIAILSGRLADVESAANDSRLADLQHA
jgi:membrane-anchored protein YejM (alkaline phosphatase superfamily)